MSDDLDLTGKIFRSGPPGAPETTLTDLSDAIDLSDLLEEVERGERGEKAPPSLVDGPSMLMPAHSGLHSSLLSTSARSGTAEAWEAVVEELAAESRHVEDEALRGVMLCEAGRILIDRLGRQQDGELLIRKSGSPIATVLLSKSAGNVTGLANELAAYEATARDTSIDQETRAAAWVEFGQLCEERTANLNRALDAYREALQLIPKHPEALALAADAAIMLDERETAIEYLRQRIEDVASARMRETLLLDLADLIEDPEERRAIRVQAHEADPHEETALRRLIRATEDPADLGYLYRELASVSDDPISASTALHLGFLTLAEAGEPVEHLVTELAARAPERTDSTDVLAPLSEVALWVQQRIAASERSLGLHENVNVLERLARCLDDPREQALVREQLARLRLSHLRTEQAASPAPADTLTGMPKFTEERATVVDSLDSDLRFCLVHLPEHRWINEALAELLELIGDLPGLVLHLQEWARTQAAGPGRATILLRLGAVHEGLRSDLPRAAEVYELAVAEDPDNANGLRALGRVYEKMRRWPQAIATLQRQAKETDDQTERLTALRRVALMAEHEMRDVELAIATLEEVARMDPDDLLSLYQLSALCRAHARPSVLITTLQLLSERLDDDIARTAILVELGEVQELHLKQRAAARECYERALSLSPGYTPALRALARLYRDEGDLEALIGLLSPEVDPVNDPAVLALKAGRVCFEEVGDIERAIEFLEVAYQHNPDLVPARELLLQLLTASGRIREAYDLLRAQDLPRTKPLLADFHYRLGLLAEALARQPQDQDAEGPTTYEDAALQHYRAALVVQPDHGLAFERSRRLLVAHHDSDNLVRLIDEQLPHSAQDIRPFHLVRIGRLHARRPEGRGDARRAYEEAMQAAPNDPFVRREYEGLLRQLDDRTSLPAIYLSAARQSSDTHHKATLLVEAAELLLASSADEDRDVAAAAILEALREDPGNPYAVRHLERLLIEAGTTLAIKDAVGARAVRAQSDAERAIFYLESAELLELAREQEQAVRAYLAAQDALPGLAPADLGLQRISAGKYRTAAATEVRTSVHVMMAEARDAAVRSGTGDLAAADRAVRLIEQILEREPHHRDAIALARALAGQLPDATPIMQILAETFPRIEEPNLRYELALFLGENTTRLEHAVEYFEAAAAAKPDGRQALRGLVNCYRQMGDDRRAAAATERLLELFDPGEPSAIDLRMGIANFLGSSPDTLPRALEHARVVLGARGDDPRAIMLMADLLQRSGDRVEAAHLLDRIIGRERDLEKLHDIYLRKAQLLAEVAGKESPALEAIERAAQLNPGNRETVQLLVTLLNKTGQPERVGAHLQPIRSALQANIGRGAISLRDLRLLAQVAQQANPQLAEMANLVLHAIEPASTPPPAGDARAGTGRGLRRVLETPSLRTALYSTGEPSQLHELFLAVEVVVGRLMMEFPVFAPSDIVQIPREVAADSIIEAVHPWGEQLGVGPMRPAACGTHNAVVLMREHPTTLRLGINLWMQGEETAWRGLAALALGRHGLGMPRVRALSPIEMDLVLAACFESVEVFNPITADPDPRRLRDLTAQLGRLLPRRHRKDVERACQSLSSRAFAPSATARATLTTDLRLAMLISGDATACLSAACLLDSIVGGSLKQRISRSSLSQDLLGFMLSDTFLTLRAAAIS